MRFSFSPRIVSPSSTSISVHLAGAVVFDFEVDRAGRRLASCGSQPASVSLKVTSVGAGGGVSSLEPQAVAKSGQQADGQRGEQRADRDTVHLCELLLGDGG